MIDIGSQGGIIGSQGGIIAEQEISNSITHFHTVAIINSLTISLIGFIVFAIIYRIIMNNSGAYFSFSKSLIYSFVFILFTSIGVYFLSNFITNNIVLMFTSYFIGGGISVFILGKIILDDGYTDINVVIKSIFAFFLMITILSLTVIPIIQGIFIKFIF